MDGVDVDLRGPIFEGRAPQIVDAFCREVEEEVADHGVNLVHAELSHVLRNPTGYYESRIQTDRAVGDVAVTDGGVVYGPWLEGVGSRNHSTRFKGYATFRRVAPRLEDASGGIAERVLHKYLGRLG